MAFEDFIVYRDPGPDEAQRAVIVESRHRDLKFKRDDEDSTKRIRANDDDLHIAQIRYGDHFICVANSGQPEEGPCERKGMPPEKLLVRLCTNDSCTAACPDAALTPQRVRGVSAGRRRGPRRRPSRAADRP